MGGGGMLGWPPLEGMNWRGETVLGTDCASARGPARPHLAGWGAGPPLTTPDGWVISTRIIININM